MRSSQTASRHSRSISAPWVVVGYAVAAYWITQRGLPSWGVDTDLSFYLLQPLIWLGLAAIAYVGWQRLPGTIRFDRRLVAAAVMIGVVHVGVLVLSGIIGGFYTVRVRINWSAYLENTWYVGATAVGIETARCYLFHSWTRRSPAFAWMATTLGFFVLATPYAQFSALGGDAAAVVGRSLIPALAISVVATWFAEHGGLGASLAYRAPILAYVWYSLELPDLHWSTALAAGVIAGATALSLAEPLYNAIGTTQPAARPR
jgi:hypothetical protein